MGREIYPTTEMLEEDCSAYWDRHISGVLTGELFFDNRKNRTLEQLFLREWYAEGGGGGGGEWRKVI